VRALRTDTHGAHVVRFTINGPDVHQSLPVAAVVPAGSSGAHRPVLVFLHGKGQDEDTNLNDAMYAALARLGQRAPDVVFPYGGDDSYWHDRHDGRWGAYVMLQVIPQAVARLGADPARVAIGGISMGGFGALDLARLHSQHFCAVGAHSAAVWVSGGQSAAGAFDNARDFTRHNVIAAARSGSPYRSTRVWIDVGSADPFRAADTTLARAIRAHGGSVDFHVWRGGHDQSYWQGHWNDYLRFYANALAACRPR
jgi:S-formylglutathione hydrolase FrmB